MVLSTVGAIVERRRVSWVRLSLRIPLTHNFKNDKIPAIQSTYF